MKWSKPHHYFKPNQIATVLFGLQTVLTIWLSLVLLINQIMPDLMAVALILVLVGFNILTFGEIRSHWKRHTIFKKRHFVVMSLSIVVAISALFMIDQSEKIINKIRAAHDNHVYISLVVAKDSLTIDQIQQVRYARLSDQRYLDLALKQLALNATSLSDYESLVRVVFAQPFTAILINEAYRDLITETDPDFSQKTKILQTFKFSKDAPEQNVQNNQPTQLQRQAFNLYISGIDTYGNVAAVSRSDVNIVASINPKTRKVVLVNVPRDAYVKIPYGGQNQFDKLTHAGLYGAPASMGALENLLGVPIQSYIRINFTSLIRVIDYFGGVSIDNSVSFKAVTGDYFPAGRIKLNSKQALAYARERKHLAGGDFDRGANQQRLIQAIFYEMAHQKDVARLYQAIERLSDAVQTNIARERIKQLLNLQVSQARNWYFETINITGHGQTGGLKSFAMPNARLYMMVPDQHSVAEAKAKIEANLK